jgi:hypothetical protein
MFEQIMVTGYVGKVIKGNGATPYLRVSIASTVGFKNKKGETRESTNWYSTTLWDERRIAHYAGKLQKGDLVLVVGTPSVRIYEKDGKKGLDFTISTEFGVRRPVQGSALCFRRNRVGGMATIKELNDKFRRFGVGHGRLVITNGVLRLPRKERQDLLCKVETFDKFDKENDPGGRHESGSIKQGGVAYFWKIDYYNLDLTQGSKNPGDENLTHRILTVMRADEY